MSDFDPYKVLDLDRKANPDQIKRAYRQKAARFHPDRNPSEEAKLRFVEVSEAFALLSDPARRALFDREGITDPNARPRGGFREQVSDLVGSLKRGAEEGPKAPGGHDVRVGVEIALEEALKGATRLVRYHRKELCESCGGSRMQPGTKPITCPACQGSGEAKSAQKIPGAKSPCQQCRGRGKLIKEFCQACKGRGRADRERAVTVTIPAGIETGMAIRHRGEGEIGSDLSDPGDLYVTITVAEHPVFSRRGPDLFRQLEVSSILAALGGEVSVETLDGTRAFTLPAGAQHGATYRLKGFGLPVRGSKERGDLHVSIALRTPTEVTPEQRALLEQFLEAERRRSQASAEGAR